MATRLVLLRARLLFPETPEVAAAAWLGTRPVLGQEVFSCGAPERLGAWVEADHAVDVVAFLWASLSLFEDKADGVETEARYRPAWTALYTVADARARILGEEGEGEALERFLPEGPDMATGEGDDDPPLRRLRLSTAWATTFSASLEPAKLGDVELAQGEAFAPVHVRRSPAKVVR